MIGPWELSNIIYVVIVIAFVIAVAYTVVHNTRIRKRQRELLRPGEEILNTPSSIVAATESLQHDRHK
ncbi:MAG TPA: hypothetical protein VFC39_19190 [Acidobacteriaceae bacterium]|nr:hypothetical protein [Acidobacteriaceae bacterium]